MQTVYPWPVPTPAIMAYAQAHRCALPNPVLLDVLCLVRVATV
jgi:hypothetical protein